MRNHDGETSMDSKMEDTPANYDHQNRRPALDSNESIDEEGAEHEGPGTGTDEDGDYGSGPEDQGLKKKRRKRKQKKPKLATVEFLQPTDREKNMAGAYGGQAIGSIRRQGIKYDA